MLDAELLSEVITPLQGVLSFGVYTEPRAEDAEHNTRHRAETGELVRQAKYHPPGSMTAQQAFATLSIAMAGAARTLDPPPSVVVATPSSQTGFSERLADDIAAGLRLPLRSPDRHQPPSAAAKVGGLRRASFEFAEPLDEVVVIVDDVLRTGATMQSVAQAALYAGAVTVWGLVAAHLAA